MVLINPHKIVDCSYLKHRSYSLAFTNGCFDILHTGHIQSLKFAKSKADKLVVALNSDSSIKNLKGNSRPILTLEHRMNVISSLEFVDYVLYFDEETPLNLIKKIKPDYLIKGSDYKIESVVGKEFVKEIFLAPFFDGISTTRIIEDILLRNMNDN